MGGDFYVNIHSAMHPGGEIRGQIYPGISTRSTLTTDTTFDLTIPIDLPPGESILGATATFNGADVLAGLIACIDVNIANLADRPGLAATCPGLQLPEGSHTFIVQVDRTNGPFIFVADWEVLPTQP